MLRDKPIKSASAEFKANPFFLIQSNGKNQRFVASFQNGEKIKCFLQSFINASESNLQIKLRDHDDHENPVEFVGSAAKQELLAVLDTFEDVIFHDGYHELMIRRPKSGDYVAFDDHGLIFIYSENNFSKELTELGLEYKVEERLIYEFNHWHLRSPNAVVDLEKLVRKLGLVVVEQ